MTPERWQEIKIILEQVLRLPLADRKKYLDESCKNATLRQDIESLILHGEAADALSDPAAGLNLGTVTEVTETAVRNAGFGVESAEGQKLGPYRLRREIGRGGMGAVYLAVRDDDEFKKRVAIKLLQKGMQTDAVMRRFRNERQILAGINHPHVAELYDGGTTAQGLPYFVMEYIDGRPIDAYCDDRKLSIIERLKLFRKVCSAVHFAHQNLVVHRDLKPANILVTTDGDPKLLDFGIAKLLNPELTASTLDATGVEVRLMTPDYASPEQVRGEPITTASDVYSLGVLLYELLTGHRPYRIQSRQLHEIARVICEEEPARPSLVIDEVAEVRSADGTTGRITPESVSKTREGTRDKLHRRLRGDLDDIVLMAMRKEAHRRYASVEQLSEDLRRVLEGLPVKARRGTLTYRLSKFIGRHRASLTAAAVVVLALLGFTALTLQARAIAEEERDRAEDEAAKAHAINEFMQETLGSASPFDGSARGVTVEDVLGGAVRRLEWSFSDRPEVKAAVENSIGLTYLELGRFQESEELLRGSLKQREEVLGKDHPDVAESLAGLASLLDEQAEYDEAVELYGRALTIYRKVLGRDHVRVASTLNDLALVLSQQGEYEEAERTYLEALDVFRRLHVERHADLGAILGNLALLAQERGRYDEAETLSRESLAMARAVHGPEHPNVASEMNNLGNLLISAKKYDAARSLLEEALELRRRLFGEVHPDVAMTLNNLASVLVRQGEIPAAEGMFREGLAIDRKIFGSEHPDVGIDLTNLAGLLERSGKYEAAQPLHQEACAVFLASLGEGHWLLAQARSNYARTLIALQNYEGAQELLLAAHPVLQQQFGDAHERTGKAVGRLVELYEAWGKAEKAAEYRAMLGTETTGEER